MVAYTFTKTLNDTEPLYAYIISNSTFSTLQSITYSNSVLVLNFPAALSASSQTLLTTLVNAYINPATQALTTESVLSVFNSTSAVLAAGATFTGNWEDVSRYTTVRVCCTSNVASAASGISIEFGLLSPQTDAAKVYTLSDFTRVYTQIN